MTPAAPASSRPLVVTSSQENALVGREALGGFPSGWDTREYPDSAFLPENLARNLALPPGRSVFNAPPSLFFSINFRGLDKRGEAFALWEAKGIPVAVWCVDNPWNLLSGLRDSFWQKTHLFVTDASFIPGLKAHGARSVHHLPLGASLERFSPSTPAGEDSSFSALPPMQPIVFVGRSAFPDKERFFVGQNLPSASLEEAETVLDSGGRPDFFWWLRCLGLEQRAAPLWPGSAVRRASLGAEESNVAWKRRCLHAALSVGLTIYGDTGWQTQFSGCATQPEFRAPVDYYGALPHIYRQAEFSLAITSMLLPHGVNQRHFDVWAAGGFCLMDASPGLELFPKELTDPVTFKTPEDIPLLARDFRNAPAWKHDLAQRWQAHIRNEHSYARRMQTLLRAIGS